MRKEGLWIFLCSAFSLGGKWREKIGKGKKTRNKIFKVGVLARVDNLFDLCVEIMTQVGSETPVKLKFVVGISDIF